MEPHGGAISDRIRAGEIPRDYVFPAKRPSTAGVPTPDAIAGGKGQGLGQGATRKRSGPGAKTTED